MFLECVAAGDDDRGDEGTVVSSVFSYGSAGGGWGDQLGAGGDCGEECGGVSWAVDTEKEGKDNAETLREQSLSREEGIAERVARGSLWAVGLKLRFFAYLR